jgi:aromatic amino acid aminotransferase I
MVWKLFGSSPPTKTMVVPKYDADPDAIQLSTTLQYSTAAGHPTLQNFVHEFSKTMFQPLNPNTQTFIHAGNTDAWTKCVGTFCNPGEIILTEEWAYVSALKAAEPHGVKSVGVPMDGEGMRADALEEILANWDVKARGAAR